MTMTRAARRYPRTVVLPKIRWRLHVRSAVMVAVTAVILCALGIVALTHGEYPIGPGEAVRALGGAHSDRLAVYFVQQMRVPRVLAAILVGAMLGVSGAIFQSLTANPLGSPDITGFTVGAATGAVLQIIVFGGGPVAIACGAVLGGLGTGAIVFLLSGGRVLDTTTFVLVGLGVSFVLQAVNSLLLVRASLDRAQNAALWMAGSLNGVSWPTVALLALVAGAMVPVLLVYGAGMTVLELGEGLGGGLGVEVVRTKTVLVATAITLLAVAVAACGPISFVALAAPQLARRLADSPGTSLLAAAAMGAVVTLAADITAQRMFAPVELPVGVVTGVLGGGYLLWLLLLRRRKEIR